MIFQGRVRLMCKSSRNSEGQSIDIGQFSSKGYPPGKYCLLFTDLPGQPFSLAIGKPNRKRTVLYFPKKYFQTQNRKLAQVGKPSVREAILIGPVE